MGLLLFVIDGHSQTPTVDPINDETGFPGGGFCIEAPISNSGPPGFGPYLQIVVPPGLTFDSASLFGSGVSVTNAGVFPPAPGNQVTDSFINQQVTGPEGGTLILVQPPIGSLVDGAPALDVEICFNVDPSLPVGVPVSVSVTPVYELGDTPTGDNGPIIGSGETFNFTPTLVEFSKTNSAPEGERPPGPSWPVTFTLTADVAPTNTLDNVVITDVLPAGFILNVA